MKYRNIINIFTKEMPKPLGRWNIDYCSIIINKKIDLSNEDHCGVCHQYEEIDIHQKNNYIDDKMKIKKDN